MSFDTFEPAGDTPQRPEGMQLATMLRCFAAVVFFAHHIATVPTYETRGGHASRALQVTLPPGPFLDLSGHARAAPCDC